MKVDSAHKSKWEIAEVVFGVPFLMGIGLHFLVPFSFHQGIFRQTLLLVGIVFIFFSIGFIVSARREFARYSQPTDPGYPTSKLVKTGVFAISRNPLYLASVILFSIIICHYVLIIPEEKYLTAKFGEEYRDYTATVHRWLGRSN